MNVNELDEEGNTPMMMLALRGGIPTDVFIGITARMIKAGADLSVKNKYGEPVNVMRVSQYRVGQRQYKCGPCTYDQEWAEGRLPIINGILYQSGEIAQLNIVGDYKNRKIVAASKLHVSDLFINDELIWTEIAILDEADDILSKFNIFCGQGAFGGDGFVVVESKTDAQIKWIAFFEHSNPFEKIEVVDDIIYVYNNLREKWSFSINVPTEIEIELIPWIP